MNHVQGELDGIGALVTASSITDDEKKMAHWCLQQLPALCEAFERTYESRYADEIVRLERALLARVSERKPATPGYTELGANLLDRLRELHEQMGLPELQIRTARPRVRKGV